MSVRLSKLGNIVQLCFVVFLHRLIFLTLIPFEFNLGAKDIEDTELVLLLIINDINRLQTIRVVRKIIFVV